MKGKKKEEERDLRKRERGAEAKGGGHTNAGMVEADKTWRNLIKEGERRMRCVR